MEIPREVQASISEKQQRAWENGLIQAFNWYVSNVMQPTRKETRKETTLSLANITYISLFDGYVSPIGEYEGRVRMFDERRQLLFELAFRGYTEGSSPQWATEGPSAQNAVKAFVEGPWVDCFLSFIRECKEKEDLDQIERQRQSEISEKESLKSLKKRFGLA